MFLDLLQLTNYSKHPKRLVPIKLDSNNINVRCHKGKLHKKTMEVLEAQLEQIAFVENSLVEMTILEAKGPNVNFMKIPQQGTMLSSTLEKSIDTRQNLLGYSMI